jgi:hypothetical protein
MLIDNTLCSLSADGTQWIYGQPRPRVAVSPGVPILLKSEYVLLSFVFSIVLGNAGGVQSGRKRRDKKLCQRADNRSFTVERSEQVRRNSLDKELLLRHVRGDLIVVACKACALTEEMVRNAVVKRHGASTPMRTLRRRMGLGCSRMNAADGVDRCELRISGKLLIDAD